MVVVCGCVRACMRAWLRLGHRQGAEAGVGGYLHGHPHILIWNPQISIVAPALLLYHRAHTSPEADLQTVKEPQGNHHSDRKQDPCGI